MKKLTRRFIDSKETFNTQNIILAAVIIAVAVIHFAFQMSLSQNEDLKTEKSSPKIEAVTAPVIENSQTAPVREEIAQNIEQNEVADIGQNADISPIKEESEKTYQSKRAEQNAGTKPVLNSKNYQAKRENITIPAKRRTHAISNQGSPSGDGKLVETRAERLRRTEVILTGAGE